MYTHERARTYIVIYTYRLYCKYLHVLNIIHLTNTYLHVFINILMYKYTNITHIHNSLKDSLIRNL